MQITGTHIHYFFNCQRQLWLFANGINMEQTSETVSEGKFIHETSYGNRAEKFKEIEIGPIKIDYFDNVNKVIHEIKKSTKLLESHIWQVKYYIYVFEQAGIDGVKGMLDYPKERKKEEVFLNDADKLFLNELTDKIKLIMQLEQCPELLNAPRCRNCSYYDFCYSGEINEETQN